MSNNITDYINTDRFKQFLEWLYYEQKFNGKDIIEVMFSPYKYNNEWALFNNEVYNNVND
tara:strand:+ start:1115 stop:1294 length:180 start_codon:yes stop_codon:yes gene_type:complete